MYIDYYFIENLLINYIIISCTTILTKTCNSQKNKILGATIGAIYSVLYVYPEFRYLFTIPSKIIIMTLITLISFKYKTKKEYLRIILVFYLVNVFISGSTFFIIYFTGIKHSKISYFIVCAYASCELLKCIYKDIRSIQYIKQISKEIEINLCGESIMCSALIDSGNLLKDPTTNSEVVVVKPKILRQVIGDEIDDYEYENLKLESVDELVSKFKLELKAKVRLIPYKHVGNVQGGIIVGLRSNYIKLDNSKISNVVIGISNFDNEDYDAILSPTLIGDIY